MKVKNILLHLKTVFFYRLIFKKIGLSSMIEKPVEIKRPDNICIGERVFIGKYSWLMASDEKCISLQIGEGVQIGHFSHIVAKSSIRIEDRVLIADRVFISDCTHNYEEVRYAILDQGVSILGSIVIGKGSWIGENVCICGASVGKHSVIGANSVVTKDIPDYCVAVGAPARVVKKYDQELKAWINVKEV